MIGKIIDRVNKMKRVGQGLIMLLLIFGSVITSCKQGETFIVKGVIDDGEGDTLYLEHRGLAGVELLDSAILNKAGSFSFKQPAPPNPEIYQLRIGPDAVIFAVDSTETLDVHADVSNFYHTFAVEGSYSFNQLRRVDELTMQAVQEIATLENHHEDKSLDDISYLNLLDSTLNDYKREISGIILGNPSSAAAYYAVFQKINDYLIFDPYDRKDYAMFGAVATSWNRYYPDTERTKHLYNFTVNALQVRRGEEKRAQLIERIETEDGEGLPDISLPNINGQQVALSTLQGKVVLLDFIVYNADFSPKHNIDLNNLYNRYKSLGFEVYQISFDSDEHFWKTSANNLPWITVRAPGSVSSPILSTYNVRNIPTSFIINREGSVVARIEDYSQLPDELNKVL